MKQKYKKIIKGGIFGLVVNMIANLITYRTIGLLNSVIGVVLGSLLYYLFNGKKGWF